MLTPEQVEEMKEEGFQRLLIESMENELKSAMSCIQGLLNVECSQFESRMSTIRTYLDKAEDWYEELHKK